MFVCPKPVPERKVDLYRPPKTCKDLQTDRLLRPSSVGRMTWRQKISGSKNMEKLHINCILNVKTGINTQFTQDMIRTGTRIDSGSHFHPLSPNVYNLTDSEQKSAVGIFESKKIASKARINQSETVGKDE